MLQLLYPAALGALAALAVPLAIHLWRKPARTVRLGSLRFLEDRSRPRRQLHWRERLLLALRLAGLILLALLLAGPRWQPQAPRGPRHWILLDSAASPSAGLLDRFRALQKTGYETRALKPGFPVVDLTAPRPESAPADFWSLVREADAMLPPGSQLAVFSPGRMEGLRGARPTLGHVKVDWNATPEASENEGASQPWIASLIRSADSKTNRMEGTVGRSDAGATWYTHAKLDLSGAQTSAPAPGAPAGTEQIEGRSSPEISARLRAATGPAQPWVAAVPAPASLSLHIAYDPEHAAEAQTLAAAARAAVGAEIASKASETPISIERPTADQSSSAAPADWTIWLGTAPPNAAAARTPRLWCEVGSGPVETDASWIVAPGEATIDGARLWQRLACDPKAGISGGGTAVWWRDGEGGPLLTAARTAGGEERWDFASRFDPAWTDLPRTTALAAWLRTLLFPAGDEQSVDMRDHRLADPTQCLPGAISLDHRVPLLGAPGVHATDLSPLLLALAAALFMVERILSHVRAPSRAATSRPAAQPEAAVASAS